jgi:peroxiredoxin Q/BCP
MKLQVGDTAPDFKVNDQDGNPIKLSDLKGKKVVLYFYPKDMTPGCTTQACNLRDNYKLLQKQGFEVLGISTDNEKSHRKFADKEKLPFSLLADTDKVVHEKYGTFVIDEKGKITEIISKVDTKAHTTQILKDSK